MLGAVVDKNVYVRQGEVVFGAGPIKIPVVNTHSNLPILFWHWHDVG